MTWLSTRKFGIGDAGQASGRYFFVTTYFPPSIPGESKKNLRRPSKCYAFKVNLTTHSFHAAILDPKYFLNY